MKARLKMIIAATLIFTIGSPTAAYSKTLQQLQQEKKELEQKKANVKESLSDNAEKQKAISDEIAQLDQFVTEVENELARVESELSDTNARLVESEAMLEEATKAKESQLDTFSQRVRYIYENGNIGYLQVILAAEDFSDFIVRMQYVNDIMSYDKTTLEKLKENESIIEIKTAEIETEKKQVEALVKEQQEKASELEIKMAEKQEVYNSYRLDAAKYEQELASWNAASKEIESLIAKATAPVATSTRASTAGAGTVSYTGGQFQWPVPGRSYISSGYGYRSRPIGSGSEFHTGYDIPAAYGSNIVAAEAGTVITARYVNGYGYTVMINHGNGLVTLYGHNSSLNVSEGQSVSRGQTIAFAGSTGNSTGNHCHFEVRRNGSHTSPRPFLGV